MGNHQPEHVEAPKPHVLPLSVYWGVFGALIFLTAFTVATAQVDLGPFNIPLAMAIASTKALLVALIFMHLWWDHKQNAIIFACSLIFLSVFIVLTMADTEGRAIVDSQERNFSVRDEKVQELTADKPTGPAPRFKMMDVNGIKSFEMKVPGADELKNADAEH